eukprot:UN24734
MKEALLAARDYYGEDVIVIPGHGPSTTTIQESLDYHVLYLGYLEDEVKAAIEAGLSKDETVAALATMYDKYDDLENTRLWDFVQNVINVPNAYDSFYVPDYSTPLCDDYDVEANMRDHLIDGYSPFFSPYHVVMERTQLSDRVYALFDTTENQRIFATVLGFVVGDDAVAVIDSGINKHLGCTLIQSIQEITDLPIKYVVN